MKSSILTCAIVVGIAAVHHCEHVVDLSENTHDGVAFARFQGLEEQLSRLRHPSVTSNPAQVHSEDVKAKANAFLSTLKRHKRKSHRQYGSTDIYERGYRVRPRSEEPVPLSM